MINRFKLLQNIGRFNSDAGGASHELSKLTLVYADNAQGKTTLTTILRSLTSGDPLPITERRSTRFSAPSQSGPGLAGRAVRRDVSKRRLESHV